MARMSRGRVLSAPSSYAIARLSSRLKGRGWLAAAPLGLLAAAAAAATLSPGQLAYYRARLGVSAPVVATPQPGGYVYAPPAAPQALTDPLAEAIVTWNRLRQSDRLLFQDYAAFLGQHPGWPGEAGLRRAAERAIQPDVTPPGQVVAYFVQFAPTTNAGRLRYAEALYAMAQPQAAAEQARLAWAGGQLAVEDESRLLGRFAGYLTPDDHDRRMERLLSDRATGAAGRQLAWTSPARRAIFAARLAMQTRSPDAAAQGYALGAAAERDRGFVIDRALWLRDTGQGAAARPYLAQPRQFDALPVVPEDYMEARLTIARAAAADGQWSHAYDIASKLDDIFPAGTVVRTRPYGERDDYTSLAWLAGTAAYEKLDRPGDAVAMFQRYAAGAQAPSTQAKGWYWAGRAAERAGQAEAARGYFAQAAQHFDAFYGQLAAERLGMAIPLPAQIPPALDPAATAAFEGREIVRAARMLGDIGAWQDQTQFLRQIAAAATTDQDHLLAGRLAQAIGRPDLGVMASRAARNGTGSDYVLTGYPTVSVPAPLSYRWTMIHAIMRQESQFDRQAVSSAGARGMMQLMPATARQVAGQLSLPYDYMRLTNDPAYNMMLGSTYFSAMLDQFSGNHVLAVAAYNAGPGNVRKWLGQFGDPRMPGVDVVEWIEDIPFAETRGYVQNVLGNAVVYDLLNPARATMPTVSRLSAYLGKTSAG